MSSSQVTNIISGLLGFFGSILGGVATVLFTHYYPQWLKKRNNWVKVQKRKLHRLPDIPDYLKEYFPKEKALNQIAISDVLNASAQSWKKLIPSQKEIFFQIYEWLGGNREDYEASRLAQLPPQPSPITLNRVRK